MAEAPLKLKKLLPEPAHKVQLGHSLETVRGLHPGLVKSRGGALKQIWKLEFSDGNLREVIFYFDEDLPENPLYEVLYSFKNPDTASALGFERLGPPNHNKDEWRLPMKGAKWELAAWVHDGKLIYAVPMEGTEWAMGID